MSKIFFTVDQETRVIPLCDWGENVESDPDWIVGDIPGIAYESHGIPLYKYVSGEIVQRTSEEIEADINALPPEEPSEQEMLRADVDFLLMLMEE